MLSAQDGHEQVARALLKAGANVNHSADDGRTASMQASKHGHEHVARALLKAGAALDTRGPQQFTALMFASSNGHDLCARTLLEAGADVNAAAWVGWVGCAVGVTTCICCLPCMVCGMMPCVMCGQTALDVASDESMRTILLQHNARSLRMQALCFLVGSRRRGRQKTDMSALEMTPSSRDATEHAPRTNRMDRAVQKAPLLHT